MVLLDDVQANVDGARAIGMRAITFANNAQAIANRLLDRLDHGFVWPDLVTLALAIPAFRETSDEDWLKRSELAVTFLDRYGTEIGSRGIRHNDSIPLDEFPDYLIKATLATEDRRFYEHFGIDFGGTFRALLTNARAGGVVQGG